MPKMMSRTVRYFKLMYIVAGILMSNEQICDTVDRIQIAPHVDVKPDIMPPKLQRAIQYHSIAMSAEKKVRSTWLRKLDIFYQLRRLKVRIRPFLSFNFSLWAIPNYFLECSSGYFSKKLLISSDCDMIYK